jgi:hypothetical protein
LNVANGQKNSLEKFVFGLRSVCVAIYTNDMSHTNERETMNANELVQGDVIKFRHASKRSSRIAVIRSVETSTNMLGEKVVVAKVVAGPSRRPELIWFFDNMKWEYLRNENPEIAEINAEYERLFVQS